jgi:hypothetical protein
MPAEEPGADGASAPNAAVGPAGSGTADLAAVLADPGLLAAARDALRPDGSVDAGAIVRLRTMWPADHVGLALTQAQLRRRAADKFGPAAQRMLFTDAGLEQASRPEVAALRALRFASYLGAAPGDPDAQVVADLCCGIGSDLRALDAALADGTALVGVDSDPLTAFCARHNLAAARAGMGQRPGRVRIECADAASVDQHRLAAAFIDPGRRSGGRRTFDPSAYSPPLSFVTQLSQRVPAVGAKVAPGIPHEALPDGAEAHWVSWRGDLKETALWFGPLRTAARRATLLPGGHTLTDADLPDGAQPGGGAPVGSIGGYLYEPDAAVIRAGLVAAVAAALPGGRLLDRHIAYIVADAAIQTPFAAGFAVLESMPYSQRRLRDALRARRIGAVEIKVRGLAIDPAALRTQLRLTGDQSCTVLLARLDAGPIAIIARRLAAPGG